MEEGKNSLLMVKFNCSNPRVEIKTLILNKPESLLFIGQGAGVIRTDILSSPQLG